MSELNNLSDIKENFDTIKSLLNSIRAQDVLNAGDMSKVLNVINTKLDKIDQEDNLELMNSALANMKQSLDERHSVIVSKFSTIESLFSNILKNSVDSLKSSEIKELFDIIATNLSVFSREVVSQKDTLTDIILRIEALRSDDSSSSAILSNLDTLKRELERFNNGFESIIVNLGDNFGTIVRALDDLRAKISDNHYDKDFENLYMTSNSILASIQVLDKKSVQIEETLASVLAKCDSKNTEERLSELSLQNKEIYNSISELAVNCNVEPLYQKIDNASALISSLKDILQNVDSESASDYISKLTKIEAAINKVLDENSFNKIKTNLENAISQIANTVNLSQNDLYVIKNDLETIASNIKALDIHVNFQNIQSSLTKSEVNIKTYISDLSNKFSQLSELTAQRTIDDIKQKVDILASEIKAAAGENLEALSGSLIGLKSSISDIESSSDKANEQLFKNVSERLAALENTLAGLLNAHAVSLSNTSRQMTELSGNINLKLDTVEADFSAAKDGVADLQSKINSIMEFDVQNSIENVKFDIANAQADIVNSFKSALGQVSAEDIEKINLAFETLKQQTEECKSDLISIHKDGLSELRSLLNSITSSLIDIVSYVSVADNKNNNIELEKRFGDIEYALKDYSSDSIEKINSFIKENLEKVNTRLTNFDATNQTHFQNLATKIESNSTFIREDIKKAYDELSLLKNEVFEFKEYVIEDLNNNQMKAELNDRISGIKNTIFEKLSEFEAKYITDNQARWEEFQSLLGNGVIKRIESIPEINRSVLVDVRSELVNSINTSVDNCIDKAIDEIKSFVELSEGKNNSELELFRNEFINAVSELKKEIPNITELINLDDKLENTKDKVCSHITDAFEQAFAAVAEAISANKSTSENQKDEEILNELSLLGTKIKSNIADLMETVIKKISEVKDQANSNKNDLVERLGNIETKINGFSETAFRESTERAAIANKLDNINSELKQISENAEKNSSANSAAKEALEFISANLDKIPERTAEQGKANKSDIIDRLGVLEAGIVRSLERSELTQSEIIEKLELFGNSLLKLANNGGVSVDDAVSKIEEFSQKINALSIPAAGTSDLVLNKLEELHLAVTNALTNDSFNKTNELLSELAETAEKNSTSLFSAIQQLSSNNAKYSVELHESLSLINSGLMDNVKINNERIIQEILSVKSQLDNQLTSVDDILVLCNEILDKNNKNDISKMLLDFKSEIITQMITIFNQISFSSEQEEIVNFIKQQQEELRNSVVQLAGSIDNILGSSTNIISEVNNKTEILSSQIAGLKDIITKLSGTEDTDKYTLLNIESDFAKIKLSLGSLKEESASAANLAEVRAEIDKLGSSLDKLHSEIPQEAVDYIRTQVDKLLAGVQLNETISANISELKDKLETINEAREQFKAEIEQSFNRIISNVENAAGFKELRTALQSGLSALNNALSSKIENSSASTEISTKLNTILAKQDASLAHIVAHIANINNNDILIKQEELVEQINSKLSELNTTEILNKQGKSIEQIVSYLNNIKFSDILDKQDKNFEQIIDRLNEIKIPDVKELLDSVKSEIITNLISIFNQISFEAETLELKTAVEDSFNSLKPILEDVGEKVKKIADTQSEIVEDYNNTLSRIEDTIENNHVFQLKAISEAAINTKELAEKFTSENLVDKELLSDIFANGKSLAESLELVKKQIKSIQETDPESSQYSLGDIENDLTKLRLVVSEIRSNQNKKELEAVINAIDTVINQLQDLKDFIPVDKISNINENTSEILDLLDGLALELKNIHSSQDDIIGYIQDNEKSVKDEIKDSEAAVKSDIQMSLEEFANEIKEFSSDNFSSKLSSAKNEIITQLLNVISQISFVEEQEEIISKIDGVNAQINILSSGLPDTIGTYSLQDMETDVTKLRIALEEIKSHNRSAEIDDMVKNLSSASQTLEYLKTEIPNHEISEVKEELEKIANDIISISIRTNKLLISSDEAYKSLKENIDDFRNIMGGVDERTKNLYEEVGMDKIESQVTSIRDIVGRQELTNQAFNEVFEYLAEWIDSTGEKLSYITDKLNNTEDINEIKIALEDIKNSTSVKFEIDAQSDKIDAMESKLNVIIESLEPTFQNQQERMQVLERKINKIVDFFEPAFTKQQERINKLEIMLDKILDVVSSDSGYGEAVNKLEKISDLIASKDDTQLVKKIASFEKQINKLNKNVEKLTSYVDEK